MTIQVQVSVPEDEAASASVTITPTSATMGSAQTFSVGAGESRVFAADSNQSLKIERKTIGTSDGE